MGHGLIFTMAILYRSETRERGLTMPVKNRGVRAAPFSLAEYLPYRLAVVTEAVTRVFALGYGGTHNLTIPEWRVLAVIAEFGMMSPTEVGQRTTMDKVKVSRAAQSLVTKGFLRQSQHPSDGRGRLLRLTRQGVASHARMVPLANRLEAMLIDDLGRADVAAFNRVLTKIRTRLDTDDGSGPGGGD
jgi:DNA-binding MarR family transcriptional regulator